MGAGAGRTGPGAPLVACTLVVGATARAREAAIAATLQHLHQGGASAVILEGLADATSALVPSASLLISRIAPGCLCCTGNLVLRVTLNRLLRNPPERLFIGVARGEHLDQLRSWLQSEPYDQLLELTPVLHS
jgi:G3E family GTPase